MPINVALGTSKNRDPIQAAGEALNQARENLSSDRVDLCIVFTSSSLTNPNILKTIRNYLSDQVPVCGSSGIAIITNEGEALKHGIIIVLLTFSGSIYFNSASVENISLKTPFSAGEELGDKLSFGFKNIRRDFGIIFSDGLIYDASAFLSGLQRSLGLSFPIAGGCASDSLKVHKTYLYYNDTVSNDSACGLVFGGKLNFGIGIKHGWKPLGKMRFITSSNANVVYEIDNQPAAKIYEEYFSMNVNQIRKELKRISILYPIGIFLEGEDEYLLRNLLVVDERGALIFQGSVPQGSSMRLMIGTKESCLDAARQAAEEVKKIFLGRNIKFVLVFDSASRYTLLRREAEQEINIIREVLGKDTVIAGFYTFGEQAPLKSINYQGKSYFHNQGIAILGIGD
ncbi:MAG: FIST N-terminal domain-containing protein [Candidatus Omnitrophota bacterium]|jgi:hypothetical protein